jgi:cytochrome c biogenesis protein CcmG/thiol:disulfide interchange protein DsbE
MFSKLWVKLSLVIAIVGGIAALLAYGFIRDSRSIYSPLIAKPAAPSILTRFDGGTLNSNNLLGKAVLLNFWASWCVPCRAEARALEESWQKYKERGVVFLGVNIQDKEEDARAFWKNSALPI